MNSLQEIGAAVREIRTKKQMSQRVFAAQIGWQQPAVSKFEHGERKLLDLQDLVRMAGVLEVEVEDILYGSHSIRPNAHLSAFLNEGLRAKLSALPVSELGRLAEIVEQLVEWRSV
jgi:transcriptional regulator with XRE-family HTH domain